MKILRYRERGFDWGFGLKWFVSCALGTFILGMAAYGFMWFLGEAVGQANYELLGISVAGAVFGALLALGGTLGPGLLLRQRGISPGRWIGYSVVAAAAAMSSGVTLISSQNLPMQEEAASIVFVGLALGLPMGLVQWWLLKQQGVQAAIWPLINVVGYLLSFGIVVYFSSDGREWIVGVMGLLLGAITGLGMMWLLRQDRTVAI